MVITELLLKIPYSIGWKLVNAYKNPFPVGFYCADFIDYLAFAPIKRILPDICIIAKNKTIQDLLFKEGVSSILWPAYPKVLIMARHSLHMFPSKKILKIGMRHGPYNFKEFIDSKKYNKFNLFLFTSESELKTAKSLGINNGAVIGFPKIDKLHDGSFTNEEIKKFKYKINLDDNKKTIMFSATWNKSGISAIEKWFNKLDNFVVDYNVMVTVHPFTEKKIIDIIKNTSNIRFVINEDLNPYLKISDLLISDTSSIIAEFNSLDKPIITFRIPQQKRLNIQIIKLLDEISFRVDTIDELVKTIPIALKDKNLHSEKRNYLNKIMFSNLNGRAAETAAKIIENFIKNAKVSY